MLKLAKEIPFEYYLDFYKNKQAVIVGCGPTNYNYADLMKITDPIFFINDSLFVIPQHNEDHFFFSWHQDCAKYWRSDAVYILGRGEEFLATAGYAKPKKYVKLTPFIRDENSYLNFMEGILDKEYIAKNKKLFITHGSISLIIHFIWYCGCKKVLGIGINPKTINMLHDDRIPQPYPQFEERVSKNLVGILDIQKTLFSYFNLDVEYYED